MKNQRNASTTGPSSAQSAASPPRFIPALLAVLVAALGGLLAAIMTLAAVTEFLANDVFGVMVSILVVVFGVLMFRSGCDAITGRHTSVDPGDPEIQRWESYSRRYPYLPLSRAKTDGR